MNNVQIIKNQIKSNLKTKFKNQKTVVMFNEKTGAHFYLGSNCLKGKAFVSKRGVKTWPLSGYTPQFNWNLISLKTYDNYQIAGRGGLILDFDIDYSLSVLKLVAHMSPSPNGKAGGYAGFLFQTPHEMFQLIQHLKYPLDGYTADMELVNDDSLHVKYSGQNIKAILEKKDISGAVLDSKTVQLPKVEAELLIKDFEFIF